MEDNKTVAEAPEQSEASGSALAAEIERLTAEKNELNDRLLRRQAEFDNFRRRVERERFETMEYASTEAVRAMIPILDDFERALKAETADKEYAKGMGLIYQRLLDNLTKLGLEPVPAVGTVFDPNLHHAIQKEESEEAEENAILEEYQRGYNFRGRPLRPAMVKVAVKKA